MLPNCQARSPFVLKHTTSYSNFYLCRKEMIEKSLLKTDIISTVTLNLSRLIIFL